MQLAWGIGLFNVFQSGLQKLLVVIESIDYLLGGSYGFDKEAIDYYCVRFGGSFFCSVVLCA
jgi:hypothetical protein